MTVLRCAEDQSRTGIHDTLEFLHVIVGNSIEETVRCNVCNISFPVLPNLLESVRLNISFPVVWTDGRVRSRDCQIFWDG